MSVRSKASTSSRGTLDLVAAMQWYLLPSEHPGPAEGLLIKGTILAGAEDLQSPWGSLEDEGSCTGEVSKAQLSELSIPQDLLQSTFPFRISSKWIFFIYFFFITSESNKWTESYFSLEYFLCFWKIPKADWLLWNIYLIYLFSKFMLRVPSLFSRYTDQKNISISFLK